MTFVADFVDLPRSVPVIVDRITDRDRFRGWTIRGWKTAVAEEVDAIEVDVDHPMELVIGTVVPFAWHVGDPDLLDLEAELVLRPIGADQARVDLRGRYGSRRREIPYTSVQSLVRRFLLEMGSDLEGK